MQPMLFCLPSPPCLTGCLWFCFFCWGNIAEEIQQKQFTSLQTLQSLTLRLWCSRCVHQNLMVLRNRECLNPAPGLEPFLCFWGTRRLTEPTLPSVLIAANVRLGFGLKMSDRCGIMEHEELLFMFPSQQEFWIMCLLVSTSMVGPPST